MMTEDYIRSQLDGWFVKHVGSGMFQRVRVGSDCVTTKPAEKSIWSQFGALGAKARLEKAKLKADGYVETIETKEDRRRKHVGTQVVLSDGTKRRAMGLRKDGWSREQIAKELRISRKRLVDAFNAIDAEIKEGKNV